MHRATVRVSFARYASTAASPKPAAPTKRQSYYKPKLPEDKTFEGLSKLLGQFTEKASQGKVDAVTSRHWRHTPTRRGEEQRLKNNIEEAGQKSANAHFKGHLATIQSLDQQTFNAPVVDGQADDEPKFPLETPFGSFVEMRR